MLVIGLVLSVAGIGFLCWLLFTLAVYALPFFAGLTAGLAAFHSGSGVIGALVVGVLAGGATLAIGQRRDRPASPGLLLGGPCRSFPHVHYATLPVRRLSQDQRV